MLPSEGPGQGGFPVTDLSLPRPLRPAVFLDRDGTINLEIDHLCRVEDVALEPRAAGAIARLNARGIPVVVVTNQSGIGRGKFSWTQFEAVMAHLATLLARENARWDAVYAAPHHPEAGGEYGHPNHPDRKPNPGMLLRAANEHALDLSRSWMIGDKGIDLQAGRNAGCRVALVRTGYGAGMDGNLADLVADDLSAAVDAILAGWEG
jgi:D-glycero-D-manno-heptose 1,7-bisphosphate phosphatase